MGRNAGGMDYHLLLKDTGFDCSQLKHEYRRRLPIPYSYAVLGAASKPNNN